MGIMGDNQARGIEMNTDTPSGQFQGLADWICMGIKEREDTIATLRAELEEGAIREKRQAEAATLMAERAAAAEARVKELERDAWVPIGDALWALQKGVEYTVRAKFNHIWTITHVKNAALKEQKK
jgi:hypothetical protein